MANELATRGIGYAGSIFGSATVDFNFASDKRAIDRKSFQQYINFTRATSATYTDQEGIVRFAAINTSLRSEEFDNAAWIKTAASVTPDATIAPNGTLTADSLIEDSTSAQHRVSQSTTMLDNTSYTFSVYAKANTRSTFRLSFGRKDATLPGAVIDLTNGQILQQLAGPDSVSVVSVGNGWYRCIVTANALTGAAAPILRVWITQGTSITYQGDGVSGIYLWGAQFEQGTSATDYLPTSAVINSAPRFDHNPSTKQSLGLLIESQATNNLLQSQDFATTWIQTALTVGTSISAPDASVTAQKIAEDNTIAEHRISQASAGAATTSPVAFSVFAKAAERTKVRLAFSSLASWVGGGGAAVIFDLTNGTAVVDGSTPTNFGIIAYPNGWYRCFIVGTPTASIVPNANIFIYGSTTSSYQGVPGSGIYIWGAQLEYESSPSSYIPTTTTVVTRNADVATIQGTFFSGFWNPAGGTIYSEIKRAFPVPSSLFLRAWQADDGTSGNRIEQSYYSSGQVCLISTGAVSQAEWYPAYFAQNGVKAALSFAANNVAGASNGVITGSDNTVTLPTVNRVTIGSEFGSSSFLNGHISRFSYWNSRLPNSKLQQITK